MPDKTFRIIDASLNRIGEGLRVLEDIARLVLDDASLSQQLKAMRHELVIGNDLFQQQLLGSRDAEGDVGIDLEVPREEKEKKMPAVLVANARRVQESLRTLEELAKVPDIDSSLDSEKFKHARFDLYSIEQQLISRLLCRDKQKHISGIYAVIDTRLLMGRDSLEVARQAIDEGARTIQLRDKLATKEKSLILASNLRALCTEQKVLFIINSHLDIALASDADGLHIGFDDLPIQTARRLLPLGKLIGVSVATVEEAKSAQFEGAHYIAVGSIFSPKDGSKPVSSTELRKIKRSVTLPLVAFGDIAKDDEIIAAGADAIATIGMVSCGESQSDVSQQTVQALRCGVEWINQ